MKKGLLGGIGLAVVIITRLICVAKCSVRVDEYLKQKFEPYGIITDTVNFTSISTDDETQAAIQKKVNAQQELELANIEA